jgi:DNA replication ATP-dependent helicase Dna2
MNEAALRDRLLRFVLRERHAGYQELLELWSQPLSVRVDAGDALAGLDVVELDGQGRIRFSVPENGSRFRVGDNLRLGDGSDPENAPEVTLVAQDAGTGSLVVEVPRFRGDPAAVEARLRRGGPLVLDRGDVDVTAQLHGIVRRVFESDGARPAAARALLDKRLELTSSAEDRADAERAVDKLAALGAPLNAAQGEALAAAWCTTPLQLVQGPPGTGKTWLIAILAAALGWRGERILVTAQTHRAVDNVMFALAGVARRFGRQLPLVRVSPRASARALGAAGVACCRGAARVPWPAPGRGLIVGATLFAAGGFSRQPEALFDRVVFDEAAQIPLPHALLALLAWKRWVMVGDDGQLGPVIVGRHVDEEPCASIFTHARGVTEPLLLDETHRLNDALCRFPSHCFYGGRLRPAPHAAERRLALRGSSPAELAQVIDEPEGPVLVRIDHEAQRSECPQERDAAVEIASELLERRGLSPAELAIISPFRRQNQAIERALAKKLGSGAELPVIDTVERMQGQERDVVIVSLACSDPDALRRDTSFVFSLNRLNVSLTRARRRLIVLASRRLLETMPTDFDGLCRLEVFHRLFRELPTVDWSARFVPRADR